MNILHITYDLRDRLNKEKTTAVKNLIDISRKYGISNVIDLVRVPFISEEIIVNDSGDHTKINTFGLPYGIFLRKSLDRVLDHINISQKLGHINIKNVNIIHAHKLTFEGYIGYKIAKEHSIPLVLSIRQTDSRVIKNKPNLLKLYKEILQYSSAIFYLNPYSILDLKSRIGTKFFENFVKEKLYLLPNIIDLKADISGNKEVNAFELLSIFRMDKESVHRKNIKRLLVALSLIEDNRLKLNIIGDGAYKYKVESWINKYGLNEKVCLLGQVPNSQIQQHYLKSGSFVLPSLSESFGMVYAEALVCGTPILYSEKRLGFDGFFENVGPSVDALSIDSIRNGIIDIIKNNHFYRKEIDRLKEINAFNIFSKTYIDNFYSSILLRVLRNNAE